MVVHGFAQQRNDGPATACVVRKKSRVINADTAKGVFGLSLVMDSSLPECEITVLFVGRDRYQDQGGRGCI